mgnify:CR=1 FL=1
MGPRFFIFFSNDFEKRLFIMVAFFENMSIYKIFVKKIHLLFIKNPFFCQISKFVSKIQIFTEISIFGRPLYV